MARNAALVTQLSQFLATTRDTNAFYNPDARPLFSHVFTRPDHCGRPGFCTDEHIGQDTGDVLALMSEGYNFDGVQNPPVYSVPNFYGAHGHDSELPSMSAILYAAGPDIKQGRKVNTVRNIDIAFTILEIRGVAAAPTVDGSALWKLLREGE